MKLTVVAIIVAVLAVSVKSWEAECRTKILDSFVVQLQGADMSKAVESIVTQAKAAKFSEIYDNYLNYNNDFTDRVGEDSTPDIFREAETNLDMAAVKLTMDGTLDNTNAIGKFYLQGNCCYFFNPCVSIKIGYHGTFTGVTEGTDQDVVAQSFGQAWMQELLAVIKAKLSAKPKAE